MMKTCLTLALLAVTCNVVPLSAQTNAASSHAPPTDPFVKRNVAVPVDPTKPQTTLVFTYEFYRLGQADGAKLLQGDATDEQRYAGLRDLVKQGKARLDVLQSGAVADGCQVVMEQVDVMSYPIGYRADSKGTIFPSDFKRRNVGDRLVLKAQTIQGGQACDVSFFPEQTRLSTVDDQNLQYGSTSYVACMPIFETTRVNVKPPLMPFDKACFVGTINPAISAPVPMKGAPSTSPAKEPEMGLLFARASRLQYEPADTPRDKPAGVALELSAYSMGRDQAWQILSQPPKPGSVYDAVQSLAQAGQAKLEHLSVLRTVVGVKSNTDEVHEYIYPTNFIDDQWVSQDLGFSAEVRPEVLGNGGIFNLDVTKFQILKDIGPLQWTGPIAAQVATQHIFQLQSIVAQINVGVGEHALLGTFSPPGDTGFPSPGDDGRVWIAFIQAKPVNP
jgi:hypothetical protein